VFDHQDEQHDEISNYSEINLDQLNATHDVYIFVTSFFTLRNLQRKVQTQTASSEIPADVLHEEPELHTSYCTSSRLQAGN
ncbi:hypothetical protein GBF38_008698, partial [Nibea albiflora]